MVCCGGDGGGGGGDGNGDVDGGGVVMTLTDIFVVVRHIGWPLSGSSVAQPVVKMEPNTGENIWGEYLGLECPQNMGNSGPSNSITVGNLSLVPDKSR